MQQAETHSVTLTFNTPALAKAESGQWRLFLRALVDEVDSRASPEERDEMLRGVGRRMSQLMPLPGVGTLEALQLEMNDALAAIGWGAVQLTVDEANPALTVVHSDLPRIGSTGTPPGQWLAGLLPGLYDGWFAQQPGSQNSLRTERVSVASGAGVMLRYCTQSPAREPSPYRVGLGGVTP